MMPTSLDLAPVDLAFGLAPTLLLLGAMVLALIYFLLARPEGRWPERAWPVRYFYWLVDPLVVGLGRVGVTPNAITLASLLFAVATGAALATGHFLLATWLFVLTSSCDVLDGFVARRHDEISAGGAFLDSFVDRLVEGAIFAGFALYGVSRPEAGLLTGVAVVGLIGSYAVSYARARGESLGGDAKLGLMQRPQRMVAVALAIIVAGVGPLFGGPQARATTLTVVTFILGATGVLSLGTAARRARAIISQLSLSPTPTPATGANPIAQDTPPAPPTGDNLDQVPSRG